MPRFNEFYLNLNQSYLFAEIRRRTKAFTDAHPGVRVVDLGVGDVTQPLPGAVFRNYASPSTFVLRLHRGRSKCVFWRL